MFSVAWHLLHVFDVPCSVRMLHDDDVIPQDSLARFGKFLSSQVRI